MRSLKSKEQQAQQALDDAVRRIRHALVLIDDLEQSRKVASRRSDGEIDEIESGRRQRRIQQIRQKAHNALRILGNSSRISSVSWTDDEPLPNWVYENRERARQRRSSAKDIKQNEKARTGQRRPNRFTD